MPVVERELVGVLVRTDGVAQSSYHVRDESGKESVLLTLPLTPSGRNPEAFGAAKVTVRIEYDDAQRIDLSHMHGNG